MIAFLIKAMNLLNSWLLGFFIFLFVKLTGVTLVSKNHIGYGVYGATLHHPCVALCAHRPESGLSPSPCI